MKKILLFVFMAVLLGSAYSQNSQLNEKTRATALTKFFNPLPVEPIGSKTNLFPPTHVSHLVAKGPNAVSIMDIGQSGNSFGFSGGGRTYLWADDELDAISFVHRMNVGGAYGNSRISYDVSLDGGATWNTNIQCYEPLGPGTTYPLAAGRYPQGGIVNPTGNTIPGSAYFNYFIPTLDATNGDSWGGYGYGVRRLDTTTAFTQHNLSSAHGYRQYVPDAFTITPDGNTFAVDEVVIISGGTISSWIDTVLVSKGNFNDVSNDIDYEQELVYFDQDKYISDTKIAFGPDGQTGYMSFLTHHSFTFAADSVFYPVLLKTTDGGNTWSNPIYVQLYGPDGIPDIVNYLTDSTLTVLYDPDPVPPRDQIPYTTAFDHDLVVDADGNPHIAVVVSLAGGEWNIITKRSVPGVFHLYSSDGGVNWEAHYLDSTRNFRATYAGTSESSEDNRVQLSRSQDGTKLFFSWLDSEDLGSSENDAPNIYCVGYNLTSDAYTQTKNVTKFTVAYAQAYMGSQSHYVFHVTGDQYMIPFVYQDMNVTNNADPTQFKYIHNFIIDFFVGIDDIGTPQCVVSDCFPNPTHAVTQMEIELVKPSRVSIEVTNLLGQQMFSLPSQSYSSGDHLITIDGTNLLPGIYFCTVKLDNEKHTRRLVVQ